MCVCVCVCVCVCGVCVWCVCVCVCVCGVCVCLHVPPHARSQLTAPNYLSLILFDLSFSFCKICFRVHFLTSFCKIRFRWDVDEKVLDMSSGKLGKTHYSVAVVGDTLEIVCNFKDHMNGIMAALEGKLQVMFNVQHLVVVEQLTQALAKRGQESKLECFLEPSFINDPFFYKTPINCDSLAWWAQVSKECLAALDRLLKAMETLRKDPIFDAAFASRFSSLLVKPDPTNRVRDKDAPNTYSLAEDKAQFQLVFAYNMNDGAQAAQAAGIKLGALLNVKVAQAIAAARKDAQDQLIKFKASISGTDVALLNFFEEPAFTSLADDKALAGCTALKPWLAGAIRQLGLVVSRNALVFKSKVKLVQFGLNAANSIKGADESTVVLEGDVLTIIQNMASAAKPDATLTQRVDNVLDVTMANVTTELLADMKVLLSSILLLLAFSFAVLSSYFSLFSSCLLTELLRHEGARRVAELIAQDSRPRGQHRLCL